MSWVRRAGRQPRSEWHSCRVLKTTDADSEADRKGARRRRRRSSIPLGQREKLQDTKRYYAQRQARPPFMAHPSFDSHHPDKARTKKGIAQSVIIEIEALQRPPRSCESQVSLSLPNLIFPSSISRLPSHVIAALVHQKVLRSAVKDDWVPKQRKRRAEKKNTVESRVD